MRGQVGRVWQERVKTTTVVRCLLLQQADRAEAGQERASKPRVVHAVLPRWADVARGVGRAQPRGGDYLDMSSASTKNAMPGALAGAGR
jgi:hypothetical protein